MRYIVKRNTKTKTKDLWKWHKWFAWHPVIIRYDENNNTILVWLQTVERKIATEYGLLFLWFDSKEWDYKLAGPQIKKGE